MGINPTLRQRNDLDYVIVSDGGKPFERKQEPTESGAMVLRQSIDIMMEQIRGLEFQKMELMKAANKKPTPLWFSIDSRTGSKPGDAWLASRIGTNLKALSDDELAVLVRQGGNLVNERIKDHAPELLTG